MYCRRGRGTVYLSVPKHPFSHDLLIGNTHGHSQRIFEAATPELHNKMQRLFCPQIDDFPLLSKSKEVFHSQKVCRQCEHLQYIGLQANNNIYKALPIIPVCSSNHHIRTHLNKQALVDVKQAKLAIFGSLKCFVSFYKSKLVLKGAIWYYIFFIYIKYKWCGEMRHK